MQTFWARDIGDPVDENVCTHLRTVPRNWTDHSLVDGTHPMYMEIRYNETTKQSVANGVFLLK